MARAQDASTPALASDQASACSRGGFLVTGAPASYTTGSAAPDFNQTRVTTDGSAAYQALVMDITKHPRHLLPTNDGSRARRINFSNGI
jgi:hypothetical protein